MAYIRKSLGGFHRRRSISIQMFLFPSIRSFPLIDENFFCLQGCLSTFLGPHISAQIFRFAPFSSRCTGGRRSFGLFPFGAFRTRGTNHPQGITPAIPICLICHRGIFSRRGISRRVYLVKAFQINATKFTLNPLPDPNRRRDPTNHQWACLRNPQSGILS